MIASDVKNIGAILDNGTVKFWCYNGYGQLGQGNTTTIGNGSNEMGDNLLAIGLGTGRTATSIEAGLYFSLAILDDGTVKAWARNNQGQLGQWNTTQIGDDADKMGDNLCKRDLSSNSDATIELEY